MIAKFMTPLFFLLTFCMIGCGENSASILQPEAQPAASAMVFEDVLISDDAPAAPRMCPVIPMCMMPNLAELGWHETTQFQRGERIIRTARQSVGGPGGQCKVFAQNTVWTASGNTVWLPLSKPRPLGG